MVPCRRWALTLYFLSLGALGFGGPIALAGYMQRDLVEQRRWFTEDDYKEGLALAQLAPGPLAAQLAIYLGWVRGGVLGATLIGVAFVLPSFLIVLLLAALYVRFGGLAWMQGVFYGVGAGVIAIIARSTVKLVKLTLKKDALLWALFGLNAAVTACTESEILWLFLAAGVVVLLVRRWKQIGQKPAALSVMPAAAWLLSGLHGPAPGTTLWRLAWYFAEAGTFVFGSGLAIVPFLYGGVVDRFHWLTDRQFLDAVAVAMITPGPVVITVAFIGYLVAGPAGAAVAALCVFLPCYLFVVVPARHFRRYAKNPSLNAFVDGVTAAATGAIAGAAFVLGRRALIDVPTILIALGTLAVLIKAKKLPEPLLIVATGLVGLALKQGLGR
ncbi:MAG: chromate transporter [Byssovorax sp.]